MKNKLFCKGLSEALSDEMQAPIDYNDLMIKLENKSVRKQIRGISNQEKKHFRILRNIKKKVC